MKVLFLILNLIFPGVGSLCFGKIVQGIFQFIIWIIGTLLTFTGILAIIGLPLILVAWGWALAVSITSLSSGSRNSKYRS